MSRSNKASKKAPTQQATISAIIGQIATIARLHECSHAAASLEQGDSASVLSFVGVRQEIKLKEMLQKVVDQGDLGIIEMLPFAANAALDEHGFAIAKRAVEGLCIHRLIEDEDRHQVVSNYYFPVILPATDETHVLTERTGKILEEAWLEFGADRMETVVVTPRLYRLDEFFGMTYAGAIASLYADHAAVDRVWADSIVPLASIPDEGADSLMYVIQFQTTTDVDSLESSLHAVAADLANDEDEDEDEDEEGGEEPSGMTRVNFMNHMKTVIMAVLGQEYGVPVLAAQSGNFVEALAGATFMNEMMSVNTDLTKQLTEKGLLDKEVSFHATLHGHASPDPTRGHVEQVRISLTDSEGDIVATHIVDVTDFSEPSEANEMVQALSLRFKDKPHFHPRIQHICEDVDAPRFYTGSDWVVPSELLMSRPRPRTLH
jgi:hypothetical protein